MRCIRCPVAKDPNTIKVPTQSYDKHDSEAIYPYLNYTTLSKVVRIE